MIPTEVELATALMALRAIAYQAEHHLGFLNSVASPEDVLDKDDLKYTQGCLDALNPAILWLEEQLAYEKSSLPTESEFRSDL